MKTVKHYSFFLVIGIVLLASLPAQAQWVTLVRKVKSMHTPETDISTVMLDAKTYRVYRAIMDTLTTDKKFSVISRNNDKRFVEFTAKSYTVSMQVDSLENGLTQITVASKHSEDATKKSTDMAVEAILRVCKMAGIKCTVGKP
ncbi:MAG: hypothetical protein NTU98_14435 [Bacteroidetes bacterium]|nr:hypothetical protein [Bacteroidota bacterium]